MIEDKQTSQLIWKIDFLVLKSRNCIEVSVSNVVCFVHLFVICTITIVNLVEMANIYGTNRIDIGVVMLDLNSFFIQTHGSLLHTVCARVSNEQ